MSAPCPHCAVSMREVQARARSGYLIGLDQCPDCGGIWCDRWELFPIGSDEAARLDAVDRESFSAPVPPHDAIGKCPRCSIPLRPFRDPLLPADARIERCRVCEGMWLNRGELSRVRARAPAGRRLSDETIAELAAAYGKETRWSQVANLDSALHAAPEPLPDAAELRRELWSSVPWVVLQGLLRLLLRM